MMSCIRPKRLLNPRYRGLEGGDLRRLSERLYGVGFPPNYFIEVPCGRCLDCEKRKFRDYRIRLLYEISRFPNSIFITLTFDNPSLTRFSDNPNKSITLFLDRVRKKYGQQVRHWIVAEYGEKHGRLHYHGILFNIDIGNDELSALWKYGNTFVGYANEATAKYIVKYVTKQNTKGKNPPRVISSKGIGETWLQTPEAKLCYKALSPLMEINGLQVPIPRYYVNKLFTDEERDQISYYFYMETPKRDKWYLKGTTYTREKDFLRARKSFLSEYKGQGFLYDDYIKRARGLSKETRSRLFIVWSGDINTEFTTNLKTFDYVEDFNTEEL